MKKSARLQTAIALADIILNDGVPPEKALTDWGRGARYAGSSDRKAVRDTLYNIFRRYESLTFVTENEKSGRALVIALLTKICNFSLEDMQMIFSGEHHAPAPLTEGEIQQIRRGAPRSLSESARYHLPESLIPAFKESLGDGLADFAEENLKRAPTILRINPERTDRKTAITALEARFPKVKFEKTAYAPLGIRTSEAVSLADFPLYLDGALDIQDESGQIACDIIAAELETQKDVKILDYCAGGGGKAIPLALSLKTGEITASDIAPQRLKACAERVKRSKIDNIRIVEHADLSKSEEKFDAIILDAPCSGTGVMRRNPYHKIGLTPEKIKEYAARQAEILRNALPYLKAGGSVYYCVCSVLKAENDDIVAAFLKERPDFHLESLTQTAQDRFGPDFAAKITDNGFIRLAPHISGTDGFFIAKMTYAP